MRLLLVAVLATVAAGTGCGDTSKAPASAAGPSTTAPAVKVDPTKNPGFN